MRAPADNDTAPATASRVEIAAAAQPAPPSLVQSWPKSPTPPRSSFASGPVGGSGQVDDEFEKLVAEAEERARRALLQLRDGGSSASITGAYLDLAVELARQTRCENSTRVLLNPATGAASALRCRSWACLTCRRRRWVAVRAFLQKGIVAGWERGERVRFLTLTDGSRRGMTVAQFSAAFDRLTKLLRRGGPAPQRPQKGAGREAWERYWQACRKRTPLLGEYAVVLEIGPNGDNRLHAHVLMTGEFIPQRRLSRWAKQCGFGPVADIREVKRGDAGALAAYAGKLAGYASKTGEMEALRAKARKRLRPLRSSQRWAPGGFRAIELELGLRSNRSLPPGPWLIVAHDGTGRTRRYLQLGEKPVQWRARPQDRS